MSTILQEIGVISKLGSECSLFSHTVDLSTAKWLNDDANRAGKLIILL